MSGFQEVAFYTAPGANGTEKLWGYVQFGGTWYSFWGTLRSRTSKFSVQKKRIGTGPGAQLKAEKTAAEKGRNGYLLEPKKLRVYTDFTVQVVNQSPSVAIGNEAQPTPMPKPKRARDQKRAAEIQVTEQSVTIDQGGFW